MQERGSLRTGKRYREKYAEREHTSIQYTLFVAGVRQQSVDAINMVHERITDAETDDPLGNIVDIKTEPAANIFQKADGEYVKAYYPDATILQYEVGRKTYEVKLSNRMELKFNSRFNVIEVDD